ncbi:iron-siderophore ABC transporter substrate-binding protein [Halomonas sp. MCCC 1A11036]|uniref:Iron-siderophore ABC transporter substrate-binding protein n=1 Tax=Billgrantia zhangzhouensis TaxID=2733481 RepID=A0ABS9AE81_9GAMM|nr:iron-siderophore ABC transporter substrate-binding protein [Halomonas zhangzhouensis]MCE8020034.1 iron-siderophore ABC transporter substrate-binding protein [Halomonas zhangzhouensis]
MRPSVGVFLLLGVLALQSTAGVSAQESHDERPVRIVTLYQGATDTALALGLEPVGVVESWLERPMYRYLRDKLPAGVRYLGLETQPDLEAVAGLVPDLVVGTRYRHAAVYPLLSRIAPTVIADTAHDVEAMLEMMGEATGREVEAQALLAEWRARVADFRCRAEARLGDAWPQRVSVVSFRGDHVRLYYDGFARSVLDQLGFLRPAGQRGSGWGIKLVSRETLPALDADAIFIFMRDDAAVAELHREWTAHPLWQSLDAVEQGRVYYVDPVIWSMGAGILAAHQLLEELYEHYELHDVVHRGEGGKC